MRDNTCRADTTKGREGGSHKIRKEDDSTLPTPTQQSKAAMYSHANMTDFGQVWHQTVTAAHVMHPPCTLRYLRVAADLSRCQQVRGLHASFSRPSHPCMHWDRRHPRLRPTGLKSYHVCVTPCRMYVHPCSCPCLYDSDTTDSDTTQRTLTR